ncbi:hypothetical protein B9479_000161 [Cryptococcus floricola]|uniref:mRNA cap guanine-N(7) methyltransferase n=1 Tax=Cryptococcus floricola TaxID=2591691 RepID=A0A5D3B8G7_9TREE|nr:hypothetical protein B9479_000161 [Cryptococcus floricola]
MVYDPIRDCDIPSPSIQDSRRYPVSNYAQPTLSDRDRELGEPSSTHHPYSSHSRAVSSSSATSHSPPPPVQRIPSSSSSLRGLLNDPEPEVPRRASERTPSFSSAGGDTESHKPKLKNLLNDDPPVPISASTHSGGSLVRGSLSPKRAESRADSSGFLAPATPASAVPGYPSRLSISRSPLLHTSPPTHHIPTPSHGSPVYSAGYGEPRPGSMLPPLQPHHPHAEYEERRTSGSSFPGASTAARSPSISVSPRSQHQALPYSTSRPGSAHSAREPYTYSHQPIHLSRQNTLSPVISNRRLSEDQRPTSSSSGAGRRYTEPVAQSPVGMTQPPPNSVPSAYQPRHQSTPGSYPPPRVTPQPFSPSPSPYTHHAVVPPPRSRPYHPDRPTRVIHADEIDHLRQLARNNNPLRRKSGHAPSASRSASRAPEPTPTPRRSLPYESDTSYFPPQSAQSAGYPPQQHQWDDRSAVSASGGSINTPTPGGHGHGYPPSWEDQAASGSLQKGRGDNGNGYGYGHEKGYRQQNLGYDQEPPHGTKRGREDEVENFPSKRALSDHQAGQARSKKVAQVANFYNSRPDVGVERREFSPIIGLKKFNNWIKSVLIGKFAHRPRGKVLDVGCGKGGDLNKWKQARIALYVGIDLAEQSVDQAADRYQRLKNAFQGYFYAHDCFSNPLSDVLGPELRTRDLYDNVTMQFCMHYAFENAAKARMMIENVSMYLRPGGIFIGTIPNSDLLLERLEELPEDDEQLTFGNSCYSVQFSQRHHTGVYGHEYRFYLEDAVEDVPEYLVNWESFESLAAEYNLRLIYKKEFHEILAEEKDSRDFGPLLGKMGVLNEYGESAMDGDQWEAANLYMGFAFEKL